MFVIVLERGTPVAEHHMRTKRVNSAPVGVGRWQVAYGMLRKASASPLSLPSTSSHGATRLLQGCPNEAETTQGCYYSLFNTI